ncbi:MAG: hypothetical protein WCJ07_15650, partial [Verrucomicrobiota bacterium]
MKTKLTLFRRNGVYYSQDTATGKQKSLNTCDEAAARKMIEATNEAHRNPILNLQLARAYLAASDPANAAWQRDLAASHTRLYQFSQKSGDEMMMQAARNTDVVILNY